MNRESTQNNSALPARQPSRTGVLLKKLLGWTFAVACLWWVFHDLKFNEVARHMTSIGWGWAALAIGSQILSYVIQGYRWKMLLRPTGDVSVLRASQAIYVGLFANTILPLRAGERVRMFLVSRWLRVEFIAILPSYLVERMIDAIGPGAASMPAGDGDPSLRVAGHRGVPHPSPGDLATQRAF